MAKILILANHDVGLYKFRKELIEKLIKEHKVVISLPYGEYVDTFIRDGCVFINTNIDRRGHNPFHDLQLILHYHNILRKIKPELVITYTVKPNLYGGLLCRIRKCSYAVNITGLGTAFQKEGLLKRMIVLMYRMACQKANVVFFENEENRKIFIDYKIVPECKTYRLNGAGVNLKEFSMCEYPNDNEGLHFLFIGRVMKEKGIEELFEAAEKIKKENAEIHFDVVGPDEENYSKRLKELQERGIIHYYGYQKEVKDYIKKAHCFILPSYHEGMANTLLECGAMGRPLITSDIPGCREAVIDRITGYLVKEKDSEDLDRKIREFIELPFTAKKEMGSLSCNYISRFFDKEQIVNETYRELLKRL